MIQNMCLHEGLIQNMTPITSKSNDITIQAAIKNVSNTDSLDTILSFTNVVIEPCLKKLKLPCTDK